MEHQDRLDEEEKLREEEKKEEEKKEEDILTKSMNNHLERMKKEAYADLMLNRADNRFYRSARRTAVMQAFIAQYKP